MTGFIWHRMGYSESFDSRKATEFLDQLRNYWPSMKDCPNK
jgi:hypothetical protein